MVNRRQAIQGFAAAAAYAATRRARAQTSNPLSLPLVTSSTPLFTYLGFFNLPSDGTFSYGAGALSVSGSSSSSLGNLYANAYLSGIGAGVLGQMSIPSPTGSGGAYAGTESAKTLMAPVNVPFAGAAPGSGGTVTTGSLAYGGKLYATVAYVYDASGAQRAFLVPMNTDMTGQGAPCSANGDAGSINRMFSNSIGIVPDVWQPYVGGPAFIAGGPGGMMGLSINSQLANGYGFSTFDPTKVVAGQPVALREWINYPYNEEGRYGDGCVSALWLAGPIQRSNWSGYGNNYVVAYDRPIGCAFIPDGSRSLIFIHWHSYGPHSGAASSPCNANASGSNETPIAPDTQPYIRMQAVAYDLAAVIQNRNGGGATTAVLPYAWWEFPNWNSIIGQASTCPINGGWQNNAWAAYDPVPRPDGSHRMYWWDSSNRMHVFAVTGSGPAVNPNPPGNVLVS